jgi:DNA-binding MarR family transcriptional regulator
MTNSPPNLPRSATHAAEADASATSPSAAAPGPREKRRGDIGPLSLDAFLPYRLRNLAQTVSASFAAVYSPAYGITPPEWRIIATICEFEQTTATEISRHSGMHKATISRAVLSLEKRRLVLRSPSEVDRREEILTLTPEGRRIYDRIGPMALRYEHNLLEGLSRDDIVRLDELIRHLMDRAARTWFDADEPT